MAAHWQRGLCCRQRDLTPRGLRAVDHYRLVAPLLLLLVLAGTVVRGAEEANVTTITNTTTVPWDVHIDPTTGAVLYTQSHSVQRILVNGTVEVVAGSGTVGNSDGIGPAAYFYTPYGIAAGARDSNDVYVADFNNHCLRRVDLATRNVTTVVGLCGTDGSIDGIGTAARFYNPGGVALFRNATSGIAVYLYVAACKHSPRATEPIHWHTRALGATAAS